MKNEEAVTDDTTIADTKVPPRQISVLAGNYYGEDLTSRSARPGAYDHLSKPSRTGERLVTPGRAA